MKKKLLGIVSFCVFMLSAQLVASPSIVKLGDFKIDKAYSHHRLLLDDGNVYKPVNQYQADKLKDWQLGDNIMVLQISDKHNRFYLINTARNSQLTAKAVSLSSS